MYSRCMKQQVKYSCIISILLHHALSVDQKSGSNFWLIWPISQPRSRLGFTDITNVILVQITVMKLPINALFQRIFNFPFFSFQMCRTPRRANSNWFWIELLQRPHRTPETVRQFTQYSRKTGANLCISQYPCFLFNKCFECQWVWE